MLIKYVLGQPPLSLALAGFPPSCDPARSASRTVLAKIGIKVIVIPYSRSRPVSSEDFRESPQPQKVRKPSQLMMGGGVPGPLIHHSSAKKSVSVTSLCTRGCKLRYLPGQVGNWTVHWCFYSAAWAKCSKSEATHLQSLHGLCLILSPSCDNGGMGCTKYYQVR